MPPICQAPSVSLYFEVTGAVLACCHNRFHPLGTVPDDSIEEIWTGAAARALRSHLARGDLRHGCQACAFEIDRDNRAGSTAATFDQFVPAPWPTRMEFALSNRCNLACIMCSGTYSSRIRAERELLPPLTTPYDDGFFGQLRPFLRHLQQARFYGGEPFLIPEYQRIWDLMIEVGATTECNVTTNGTVRTSRVEAALQALPFSIGVSLDGMTADTVETIRSGASFDAVMANIEWFRAYTEARGTWFGLTYCLMTGNWQEFADFLLFAERIGAGVAVNRVSQPTRYSLFHVPAEELAVVVDGLRADGRRLEGRLVRHRATWDAQLAVLEQQLDDLRRSGPTSAGDRAAQLLREVLAGAPFTDAADLLAALARIGPGTPSALRTDTGDIVVASTSGHFLGRPDEELIGLPASQVLAGIAPDGGESMTFLADQTRAGATGRMIRLGAGPAAVDLVAVTIADGASGQFHGAVLLPPSRPIEVHVRARDPL